MADLRDEQNSPVENDKLTRKVKIGRNTDRLFLSTQVGRGSKEQVEFGDDRTTFSTSDSETWRKTEKLSPEKVGSALARWAGYGIGSLAKSVQILAIFSVKKTLKSVAYASSEEWLGRTEEDGLPKNLLQNLHISADGASTILDR